MRLLGEFMSRPMVSLTMSDGGCCVSMGGKIVKFCGPIVSGQRHVAPLSTWMRRSWSDSCSSLFRKPSKSTCVLHRAA
jgi:hypothetical protein